MATVTVHRGPEAESGLAQRLRREIEGEVLFDAFSRGRYSTDASIYQIEPLGVVIPATSQGIAAAIAIAREEGVPVLPRGGGTSQCGQTVNRAVVVDTSRHLNRVLEIDPAARKVRVEPGIVLNDLNKALKPHGLFFPVDPSTASRATLGGMAANNSCGSRSLRYGQMVDHVTGIDAILADGTSQRFGWVPGNPDGETLDPRYLDLVQRMRALATREADEIGLRFPHVLRQVAGYNITTIDPAGHNMAKLLVGSEGTLAFFTALELNLEPLPAHKVVGVCHFPTFYAAMDATRHIVALGPSAVEVVDSTLLALARDIPIFRPALETFVRGTPDALLLVEFAGDELDDQLQGLRRLGELMADLGYPDAVVEAVDPAMQRRIWELREAGLNIMMSMKGDGKPVSFIEDCAVRLEDLAEFTDRLTRLFARHGTRGTWYAHASVGCLHVRPILNLKDEGDVRKMRSIAEEAFAIVREYKGTHSGEHGDGIVRSEFHEAMLGPRIVRAFEEVKDSFDPAGLFNPGRIVRPPRMDDRSLFRYRPGYQPLPLATALDWSAWGGLTGAVEMCNNNGACRKADPGVMCPSYRVTADEQHVTRGRANTLRLALTGQLGPDAFTSDAMMETLELCVSCKACRRECPTGVDMARMKIEFLHHYRQRHGLRPKDRLVAYLPRLAPQAARMAGLANLRETVPGMRRAGERLFGLSARRSLPRWRRDVFRPVRSCSDGPARPRPPAGHLHDLLRARERPRRPARPRGRRLPRDRARPPGRPPLVLRPHLPRRRPRRRGPQRSPARPRHAGPLCRARPAGGRARAGLSPHLARRVPGHAPRRKHFCARRARGSVGGVSGDGSQAPAAAAVRLAAGAGPWPLSPEGVRRHGGSREDPAPGARPGGGRHRVQLLRHGGCLRLRSPPPRGLDAHGRARPAACGARSRPRHRPGRRRYQLPPPDPRRGRPRGRPRRARAGSSPRLTTRARLPRRRRRSSRAPRRHRRP